MKKLSAFAALMVAALALKSDAAVDDNGARIQYEATASQTAFDYPFEITADADLTVYVDGALQTLTTDYTVAGEGQDAGGTLTFVTGLDSGDIVTIVRSTEIARDTTFGQNAGLTSAAFNREFDKLFVISQELEEKFSRSLHLSETVENLGDSLEIDPTTFANSYLAFDADGLPTPAALSATTMTQSTIGALLYPRTAAEITAGVTPSQYGYAPLDVRRYGAAAADGTANSDQTALNAAVDVAEVSGGTVFLPEGTWNGCITVEAANVSIVGVGSFASILEATDCDGITLDYTAGVGSAVIRGVNVQGVTGSTRTGIKLAAGSLDDADELYGVTIENNLIRGFNVGIHSRTTRILTVTNNWIQDVDRGIEYVGKTLLSRVAFNTVVKGSGGGGSGDSTGVVLDSFNYTAGSGSVAPEGVQFTNNQVYGFETAFELVTGFFINLVANDIQATVYGVDFSTIQYGLSITDTFFDLAGANVAAGIYGRGLNSALATKVNLQNNTLNATSAPAAAVGIKINDSGNTNQFYVAIDGNYFTGDWDAGDILVNNAGPTWIINNRATSPTPTNSLSVPNVGTGPVYVSGNLLTKAFNYTAAEAAAGEIVIGPNIISAGATPTSFPGFWTTPAFSAGNFTANGSQTWTVASGDVATYEYEIVGNKMTVVFSINTSTVGGVANSQLQIAIPASKVAAKNTYNPVVIFDNGTRGIGTAQVLASGTIIIIERSDAANWAAATDTTYVRGQITFEIN